MDNLLQQQPAFDSAYDTESRYRSFMLSCRQQAPTAPSASSDLVTAASSSNATARAMQKKHSRERKVSESTRRSLRTASFDVWKWNQEEMTMLLKEMYIELGLIEALDINRSTLHQFLMGVKASYNDNPFHNFRHCFCVAQMMYVLIHGCKLQTFLPATDLAALLTACICHDLDHPGRSNAYQVNAQTALARRYADKSPLENHHRDESFKILSHPAMNIFEHCSEEEIKRIKDDISSLILATDMSRHNDFMRKFEEKLAADFDLASADHLSLLKCILIKACDISNECRPISVSEAWVECLMEEYFNQSDAEKAEGLPFAPFMDRASVTKANSQIGFIGNVLIPLFEALKRLLPEIETIALANLRGALEHYKAMRQKDEDRIKQTL